MSQLMKEKSNTKLNPAYHFSFKYDQINRDIASDYHFIPYDGLIGQGKISEVRLVVGLDRL